MIEPEDSIVYTTFASFAASVRQISFPEGIGEMVKIAHDNYIMNALIKAQRFIDCLRKIQVSFYYKNQANDHCGVSTISGPRGKINAVYSFKPSALCVKHHHRSVTPQFIACWSSETSCRWKDPDTTSYQTGYDVCYPYYQSGEEEDDAEYLCSDHYYSRGQDGSLYLAPRFPCGYIVAVHWEGLRRSWSDSDSIVADQDLIDWVALEAQSEVALRHDRDRMLHGSLKVQAQEKFADLMYWCNEERQIRMRKDCAHGIDVGNLTQMFQPIYPLPTADNTSAP